MNAPRFYNPTSNSPTKSATKSLSNQNDFISNSKSIQSKKSMIQL